MWKQKTQMNLHIFLSKLVKLSKIGLTPNDWLMPVITQAMWSDAWTWVIVLLDLILSWSLVNFQVKTNLLSCSYFLSLFLSRHVLERSDSVKCKPPRREERVKKRWENAVTLFHYKHIARELLVDTYSVQNTLKGLTDIQYRDRNKWRPRESGKRYFISNQSRY